MTPFIKTLFKQPLLHTMVSPSSPETVCFPNYKNKKIDCHINSPVAIACATVLRQGFDNSGLRLECDKNQKIITVLFNDQVIQKIVCDFIGDNENIEKKLSSLSDESSSITSNKTTYILINKNHFFKSKEQFSKHLRNLSNLSKINERHTLDGNWITAEEIRKNNLQNNESSGIHIEEYDIDNHSLLKGNKKISTDEMNSFFTITTPMVLKLSDNSYEELQDKSKKRQIDVLNERGKMPTPLSFNILLTSLNNLKIESNNPINTVTNYRDIELSKVITEKYNDFLATLIKRAKKYYSSNDELEKESCIRDYGQPKSLFSFSNNANDSKKHIHLYKNDDKNEICIHSKNTCLGNGQHSSTTFNFIYTVLTNRDPAYTFLLKYGFKDRDIYDLFPNCNNFYEIKQEIIKELYHQGISEKDFISYLEKYEIPIEWRNFSNQEEMTTAVNISNNVAQQNKNDEWINDNKDSINFFINKCNEVNQEVILKFADEVNLSIRSIKSPDFSSLVNTSIENPAHINDIYPFLNFCLSNDFYSSVDKPYKPEKYLYKSEEFKEKFQKSKTEFNKTQDLLLPCVYQYKIISNEYIRHFFDFSCFENPGSNAFYNLSSWILNDNIGPTFAGKIKNKLKDTKDDPFSAMKNLINTNYNTYLNDDDVYRKIPPIIYLKNKAEKYYSDINKCTDIGKNINKNNFLKICFLSFVQKVGKNNFNMDFMETYCDLIIKDICVDLNNYYSRDKNHIKHSIDFLKKERNAYGELQEQPELIELVKHLFEPLFNRQDKINNNFPSYLKEFIDKIPPNHYKAIYTEYESIEENLNYRKQSILSDYSLMTGETPIKKFQHNIRKF